jgi:hypothetical protein
VFVSRSLACVFLLRKAPVLLGGLQLLRLSECLQQCSERSLGLAGAELMGRFSNVNCDVHLGTRAKGCVNLTRVEREKRNVQIAGDGIAVVLHAVQEFEEDRCCPTSRGAARSTKLLTRRATAYFAAALSLKDGSGKCKGNVNFWTCE